MGSSSGGSDVPRRIQSLNAIEDAKRDGFVDLGNDNDKKSNENKKISEDKGQIFSQSILEEDDFEILTTEESFEKDKKLLAN